MKKLFLIPTIVFAYSLSAQTLQNPKYGTTTTNNLKILTPATVTSVNFLTTIELDGTINKISPVNLGFSKYLGWKSPQDYGAVGDGIADDTNAINQCLINNKNVLFYGSYKITDYLEVFSDQFIFSNNATITRNSVNSAMLAALNRENIQIKGSLTLIGNGNAAGTNSGIKMSGVDNFKIDGVTFKNISGIGLWIEAGAVTSPRGKGGLISNTNAINCYTGIQFDFGSQGEYHSVVNFNATQCNTGANIFAGNVSMTGGNIVDNTTGIYLGNTLSTNNSHGILNGININHNVLNLKVLNAEFGETIVGCHFYGDATNNIEITTSRGISFSNCIIDGKVSANGGTNIFSGCQIDDLTTFTGSDIKIIDCFKRDGGMYISNNYDIKGLNHAVGSGYADTGNINIFTDDTFGINKGGSLSFGGKYTNTGGLASFAKIHGKTETSVSGSLDGYMAFEVSNNNVSPYSREVGRFSSNGNFTVLGTAKASPAVLSTELPTLGQINALDANNVKLTGNQTKNGQLTINSNVGVPALTAINTSNVAAIQASSNSATGIEVSSTSGRGIRVNNSTGNTSDLITLNLNNSTKFNVDYLGNSTANSFIKTGGTADQRLNADGSTSTVLSGSAVLDFPATSTGTSSELTIAVTGAAEGDVVALGVPNTSSNANTSYTARVSAANTVTVKHNNYGASSSNPASGTFKVKVFK